VNVVVVTEVDEFLPREVGAIVGDNRIWNVEAIYDVSEEC
jgi:hypothetical protein